MVELKKVQNIQVEMVVLVVEVEVIHQVQYQQVQVILLQQVQLKELLEH